MTKVNELLKITNLCVDIEDKRVINNLSLAIPSGHLLVLMGANGSGKSSLGMTLAGNPKYRVISGNVEFDGNDLLEMKPEERAQAGLFLSFQSPPDIPGVKNNLFLRTSLNSIRQAQKFTELDAFDFLGVAKKEAHSLGLDASMLSRSVNDGFSGGERKRNELLQLSLLKPRLAILDEIDSGLDVDGVRDTIDLIKRLRDRGTAFIIISHYPHLIEALKPDTVLVLKEGAIIASGGVELAREINSDGFHNE